MKVPLRHGCGRDGSLHAERNSDGPEIDQDKVHPQPPRRCVNDELADGRPGGRVSTKKDSRKHRKPYPGETDDEA